jgi:choline/glycine/proline betaine transport protein
MGMIATGGQLNPKRWIRTFFTLITALLAIALLLTGGLTALQTAAIIIALPFSIVMLLICWSTIIAFTRERRAYAKAERAQFIDHIGEHYGLEVEEPLERGLVAGQPKWVRGLRRRLRLGTDAAAPRRASPATLAEENALPDSVPTADVDAIVDHDPLAVTDDPDIPEHGEDEPRGIPQ